MKSVRLNNLSLKYQICSPLGCKDIGIRKLACVAKTQFLLNPQQIPRSELIFKIPPPSSSPSLQLRDDNISNIFCPEQSPNI